MMDYEIFKELVTEQFKEFLSEEFKDMDIVVSPVDKVNRTLDGIRFVSDKEGVMASPTIYINDMYDHYMKCMDLHGVLHDAATRMEEVMKEHPVIPEINTESVKDNIIFQLVNTEQNKEMLKKMPHREFEDLSVIYRWVINMGIDGVSSTKIDNKLAERFNLCEQQLFELAEKNTKRILPPRIENLDNILKTGISPTGDMWVISNDRYINGAATILYEDELYKLSQKSGTDLFIIPSSIHEVIALPVDNIDAYEIAEQVYEINRSFVELEERLSNQVYHYDRNLRKVTLATDTPYKRLDNVVAELPMAYETKQLR